MYTRFHFYLKIQNLKFIYIILKENKNYLGNGGTAITHHRYRSNFRNIVIVITVNNPVDASIEKIFQKFTMIEHSRQLDTATRPFANLNP